MRCHTPVWCLPILGLSFGVSLCIVTEWNQKLVDAPVHGQILAGQAVGFSSAETSTRVGRRIHKTSVERKAEYFFVNFNQDRVNIAYRMADADFRRYNSSYGYRPEDLDALRRWRDLALARAQNLAGPSRENMAAGAETPAQIRRLFDQKVREYLASRGFRLESGNVTRIDMPLIVKKNGPMLRPIAESFDQIAIRRRYRSLEIIGSVLSFVQTAVQYREPDDVYKGKHTGGILAPITTVLLGWGDCDTKTALLSSILVNWPQMRMIGISVPGHYLMAVLEIPEKGDLYVEYQGLKYVLLEPAGPAWIPPGTVAEETVSQLNSNEGYKIDQFF